MKYETDPIKIRKKSFKSIREQVSLEHLGEQEQQIAVQMMQACGDLSILDNLRFSESVIEKGLEALEEDYDLLCDTDTVICGLKQKHLKNEPICLISKANVISQAKASKKTRSMTAVDSWKTYLPESIILIGNESTALFRLLELLEEIKDEDSDKKPALIIATPVGFTGAIESKQLLWEKHEELGIPCITLLGTRGSSNLTSTAMNALLKIQHNRNNKN